MSVVLQNTVPAVNARDLIYSLNGADQTLVQYVIQQTVESTVELLLDTQDCFDGELTRSRINEHLTTVKEGARDMIEDFLGDLRRGMLDALAAAAVKTTVINMQYNPASDYLEDATVAVEVDFAK